MSREREEFLSIVEQMERTGGKRERERNGKKEEKNRERERKKKERES